MDNTGKIQYTTPQQAQNMSNPQQTSVGELSGADLMQALAAGKTMDGKKFFGVYASGDPTGANRRAAYEQVASTGISADIAKYAGSKITEDTINNSAAKYGVDPVMIATILKMDSSYGTQGMGARNNNP
jgi:hypothetical protein